MMNVWNASDQVLDLSYASPWMVAELAQKPNVGLAGLSDDGPTVQYWAALESTLVGTGPDSVWTGTPESGGQRAAKSREWAELAFYFQPLSGPLGGMTSPLGPHVQDLDVERFAGAGGLWGDTRHTDT
jgi:hypothetical protein